MAVPGGNGHTGNTDYPGTVAMATLAGVEVHQLAFQPLGMVQEWLQVLVPVVQAGRFQ